MIQEVFQRLNSETLKSVWPFNWSIKSQSCLLKLLGGTKKCHPQVGGWIDEKSLFSATRVGQTGIFVTLRHVVRRV